MAIINLKKEISMRKNIFKIIVPLLILVLTVSIFAGCKKHEEEGKDDEVTSNGITAEVTEALLIKGESFTLGYEFTPPNAKGEVEFSSENDCVTVDKEGKITAVKAGSSIITVKEKKGEKYAQCKVIVGDIIVDSKAKEPATPTFGGGNISLSTITTKFMTTASNEENGKDDSSNEDDKNQGEENKNNGEENKDVVKNYGGKYGSTLFKTVQEGITNAKEGNTILIQSGTYSEKVNVSKSVTLYGVKKPQLKGVEIGENLTVALEGLNIVDNEYPVGTSARVVVKNGATLKMENCFISTNTKEKLSGGFGILFEKQAKKIELSNNAISNLRYGIYVCPTDGEVKITKNDLSNLEVGIGLDIRQENSDMNYPTKGEINMNTYNEVLSNTQFMHYGDSYNGDFDFKDSEKDNAATDEGNTGGSGLTE